MQEINEKNKGKLGGSFVGCLIVFLLVIGGGIFAAGYFGLIPQMSEVLGTSKARDLGIRYANVDLNKLKDSIGIKTVVSKSDAESSSEAGISFEGSKPTKYSIDSEKLTALANSPWRYVPFTDVQIKIGDDGVVETSAMMRADRIINFAKSLGYSQDQIDQVMQDYNIPATNIPVYAKGNFSITNGQVEMQAQTIEIGRIKLPSVLVEKVSPPITQVVQTLATKTFPGFSIKNLSFDEGKMNFEGTVPTKETILSE